jgi:hypothetical protein
MQLVDLVLIVVLASPLPYFDIQLNALQVSAFCPAS